MWSIELFRGRSNCSSVILARHAATCVHSHIRMFWRKPLHACMIYASSCTHYCCRAIRACSWSGSDAVPRLQASLLVRSCHPKEVDTYILLVTYCCRLGLGHLDSAGGTTWLCSTHVHTWVVVWACKSMVECIVLVDCAQTMVTAHVCGWGRESVLQCGNLDAVCSSLATHATGDCTCLCTELTDVGLRGAMYGAWGQLAADCTLCLLYGMVTECL
jgi:hypothetical protein